MPRRSTQPKPEDADDDVVDAHIFGDDEEADAGAMLAIPWDERKAELAAEALIAKSLAWHAHARTLLNDCNIEELAAHIDSAADWLPGPTRLRRLVPFEVAADIAARYVPAMTPKPEIPTVKIRRVPLDEAPTVYSAPLLATDEWPTLARLFAEDGATTEDDVWGAAH